MGIMKNKIIYVKPSTEKSLRALKVVAITINKY